MRYSRVLAVFALVGLLAVPSLPAAGFPANFKTRRMSVNSNGVGADLSSWNVDISANGRVVAFASHGTNLVGNDNNGVTDVFVHNRETGKTRRVSVHSNGSEADEGSDPSSGYYAVAISANGRFVTFESGASDLVGGDDNDRYDIFVHDRETGRTRRVTQGVNGQEPDDESYYNVDISHDGKFIAFHSYAENLAPNDDNGYGDVFVANRETGNIRLVSVRSNGNQANETSGDNSVSISPDGRYVAFDSEADDLVANDSNSSEDVFLHDRKMGKTRRVSVANNENEGNHHSGDNVDISANGNLVAFSSVAGNLVVADDHPGYMDVFVRNIDKGTTDRVSVHSNGQEGDADSGLGDGGQYDTMLEMSSSGRFLVFASEATNLVGDDTLGHMDVFLHDRKAGKTRRVSVKGNGDQGNNDSGNHGIAMTPDGRFVGYASNATDLAPGDNNGTNYDIYLSGPLHN